jgi:hypothetical protein
MRPPTALRALIASLLLLLSTTPGVASAQTPPRLSDTDRVRLAEAFRIADSLGERLWAGWNKAPFAVLLVTPNNEFLVRHDRPSPDFTLLSHDRLLKSKVYFRKRTQPISLLATFPLVGGVPTIVIGQAENTSKKTSAAWVITLLHEHFHQLQYSQPGYYDEVNSLGLTRGDQTGMWMLNYPFPYDWEEMKHHFSLLGSLLTDAINAIDAKTESEFAVRFSAYLKQRRELEHTLSPDDYRYLSFQMWQEGIARYTEYRMANLAGRRYRPTKAFRALKDYQPFARVAEQTKENILAELKNAQLGTSQRVLFYALGAGEGLLLDRLNPSWRGRYLTEKFYLDKYYPGQ